MNDFHLIDEEIKSLQSKPLWEAVLFVTHSKKFIIHHDPRKHASTHTYNRG